MSVKRFLLVEKRSTKSISIVCRTAGVSALLQTKLSSTARPDAQEYQPALFRPKCKAQLKKSDTPVIRSQMWVAQKQQFSFLVCACVWGGGGWAFRKLEDRARWREKEIVYKYYNPKRGKYCWISLQIYITNFKHIENLIHYFVCSRYTDV